MKEDLSIRRLKFPFQVTTAMEVCFAASGEKLRVLDADEVQGQSAKTVKQSLALQVGVTRFRQKLFWEDGCEIQDDEVFTSLPVKVQLIVSEFWPPDAEQDKKMIFSAKVGDELALEWLLKCPRDPNTIDKRGFTPLHHAAMSGRLEPARLLLEAGAEREARNLAMHGMVPLHFAALRGHLDVVRVLVEAGAEKDQPATHGGLTPIELAASQGHLDVVRFLVEVGAKIEPETRLGLAPLHIATQKEHLDIVALLLGSRANVDQPATDGAGTPLQIAVRHGHVEIARLLLEFGANKDQPVMDSLATPLHLAAEKGHLEVVRLLVESGARCHLTTKDGRTAMDVALDYGHVEIVRFLSELCAKGEEKRARRTLGTRDVTYCSPLVPACFGNATLHGDLVGGVLGFSADGAKIWWPLSERVGASEK
eukprot:s32_g31.t1